MNSPMERRLETLQPNLTPEEATLLALLDLNEFQEMGPSQAVSGFYTAFTGEVAPNGLRTRISTYAVEQEPQAPPHFSTQKSYVDGFDIAATVVVDFYDRESDVREMLNLDFVKTTEGLQLIQRQLVSDGDGVSPRYTRRVSEEELTALARDAAATKELIVEEDAELMKLGPLVEEQAEDGSRRFHIGDILSITTSSPTSPRGMDGIRDILGYMTDDCPSNTQLGRFAEECRPYLEQQLSKAIQPYFEVPETITDKLSLYRWLHTVTEGMNGDPFLRVGKVDPKDHTVMDVMSELALDYGPEIIEKVTQIDPNLIERDEE